jgi:hypothetical protein
MIENQNVGSAMRQMALAHFSARHRGDRSALVVDHID